MVIQANITNKYITKDREAIKTLHISIKESVTIMQGDVIILNPKNLGIVEIISKEVGMVSLPYNDN